MSISSHASESLVQRPVNPLLLDRAFAREGLPDRVNVPETTLFENLELSARRFPDKTAIQFYGSAISYRQLLEDATRLAGYLQQECGVRRGDRVLLFSQNCPQFIAAYFAILRADAVVVPVNAMLLQDELKHIVTDSGAVAGFAAQELVDKLAPLLEQTSLAHIVVHAYGDALADDDSAEQAPEWVRVRASHAHRFAGAHDWQQALNRACQPRAHDARADDLCMLPYTSGTTGKPKACMHTHRSVMTSVAGSQVWRGSHPESVYLAPAPYFHLLGLQNGINSPIYMGGTIVLLPRWDARVALDMIERHRVTCCAALPAMLVDVFSQPDIETRDLSSLTLLAGGGAAMPESTAKLMLERYGLRFVEGYGLTETAAFVLHNPLYRPKSGCLGIPTYGVDARVLDPVTLVEVPRGEVGEIVLHGAQVMLGYWNQPRANEESFLEIDGKRFFRTGDLASIDEDGYFVMRDRLKRMINVSGYKVWPAEVEASLHTHAAIQEACVIAVRDTQRGETVKAVIALKPGHEEIGTSELLAWCREHMAVYKAPRIIELVESLPRSATGKIDWRELQEKELQA